MAKPKPKPVRTLKRHRAINDLGYFWLVLEQLTARFQDERLDDHFRFKQEYLPDDNWGSCYEAWGMLLHLTRAAIERRDPALQRACFDCVEGCEMTRNRKLILEPSYVAFWEELAFKGTRKEHLAMVDLMPRRCREFYWNLHRRVLE